MGVDMKNILMYNILLLAGCASTPVDCMTTDCIKQKAKMELVKDCIANAESYGYPIDAADWAFIRNSGLAINPHPTLFCREIAEYRIR